MVLSSIDREVGKVTFDQQSFWQTGGWEDGVEGALDLVAAEAVRR